jgi:TRAP-type C4-dicarboxylate transport system substrate-binding protein
MFQSIAHLDRVVANTDLMEMVNSGTTKRGVRVLSLIPSGAFSGLANTKRTIKKPSDLKGLRIRAKDKNQARYIEAWGANTVIIPWAEIYNSLQTGVADGYLNPSIVPIMFKHTEVLKYFSNVKFSAPLRVGICSEDWYRQLSQKDRDIVDEAVVKADAANRLWQAKVENQGIEDLKSAGIDVHENSAEEIAEFKKLVQPLYTEVVSENVAKDFIKAAEANQ